jgi:CsoR family transcriptional regulator, copper-sensing transcriptional repressor
VDPVNGNREEAVRRLKSIEGHIRGVERMLADEQQCIDIIRQILAIQGALEKLNLVLLERHLQDRCSAVLRETDERDRKKFVGELVDILETSRVL